MELEKSNLPHVAFMAVVMALVVPNLANSQQYPLMEQIANKVIAKYQNTSCAQLKQSKSTPPSGQEGEMMAKAVAQLKANPPMREAFIAKVAPPIANNMFDCGLIP